VRAILDVETTGLASSRYSVAEVAAVILGKDLEEMASFSSLVNPGEEAISNAEQAALQTNGITPAMMREAPPIEQVARELEAFLDAHWGATLHSFGRSFDMGFLEKPPWQVTRRVWGECIMLAATDMMNEAGMTVRGPNSRPKWVSLAEAKKFFKVKEDQAHRALPDARAAAYVFREILLKRAEDEMNDEAESVMEHGL